MIGATLTGASPDLLRTVLERAAGSPLYAEQLAALVRDRGLLANDATLDERVIPPTIQALLAARIDALPRELKPALLDASVIGKVFWSGAVAAMENLDRSTIEPALSDLERRELTRSQHPSTMADEAEYGFWHALLREVAYSLLPRAARLAKHRSAAAWITAKAGGALGDLSEIVVDHLRRAEELADATGAADELTAIRSDLAEALLGAASHARRVEPGRAVGYLTSALTMLAEDDRRRGTTLGALGRAQLDASDYPAAVATLQEAQAWLAGRGELLVAAELAIPLGVALRMSGDSTAATAVREAARPVLEAHPGKGLVALLEADAASHGDADRTVAQADAALELAARLGLPEAAHARIIRGLALLERGNRSGEGEIRRGIEAARVAGDLRQALQGFTQLAWAFTEYATVDDALAIYEEGLAFARDHGLEDIDLRANRLDAFEYAGRHDDVLQEVQDLKARAAQRGDAYATTWCDMEVAAVRMIRGESIEDPEGLVEAVRGVGFPPTGFVFYVARAAMDRADPETARRLISDALDAIPVGGSVYSVIENMAVALDLGDLELGHRILDRAVPPGPTGRGYLSMLAGGNACGGGRRPRRRARLVPWSRDVFRRARLAVVSRECLSRVRALPRGDGSGRRRTRSTGRSTPPGRAPQGGPVHRSKSTPSSTTFVRGPPPPQA